MKNIKYLFYSLLSVSIVFTSCDSEDDLIDERFEENPIVETPPPSGSPGTADLSNYISIGNSLTAGYSDAALSPNGQKFSYPNIVAGQFKIAGGGDFVYPDITSGDGFGGVDGSSIEGRTFISLAAATDPNADLSEIIQTTAGSALNNSSVTGSGLNNFGVPGARVIDLGVNGYGSLNPYYGAFQSSATSSILEDAISADASIFSLWIGSNDVLGYAISGGVAGESFNPLNPQTITDVATFSTAYGAVLDALTANGAEGIVLNVPPVTLIPFFQTVTTLSGGVKVLPAGSIDDATAAYLNSSAAYGEYNDGLGAAVALGKITAAEAAFRTISFTGSVANAPVITDESLTVADISAAFGYPPGTVVLPNIRQSQVDPTTGAYDLFPLTALSVLGTLADPDDVTSVYGVGVPLPDQYTLTMNEQVNVITAYATYNGIIAAQAAARPNIHLLDVGPLFADIFGLNGTQAAGLALSSDAVAAADGKIGIDVGGFNLVPLSLSQEELFNSIWSTDGVHPNPRGAAIVANKIIEKINSVYNANIPMVSVLDYPGIHVR